MKKAGTGRLPGEGGLKEGPDRSEVPSSADVLVGGGGHCRPRGQSLLKLGGRRKLGLDADQGDWEWRRDQRVHGIEIRAGHPGHVKDHGFLSELRGDLLGGLVDSGIFKILASTKTLCC